MTDVTTESDLKLITVDVIADLNLYMRVPEIAVDALPLTCGFPK